MFKKLYLTASQRREILKWTLYALVFLALLLNQTTLLGKFPIFGLKLNFVPLLLVCICIKEGPERGGIFCLITTLIQALSGVDYGGLSIAALTVCAVVSGILCNSVLNNRFLPALLCSFVTLVINETVIILFRVVLDRTAIQNLWLKAVPACALSLVAFPVIYLLVKAIEKTGGSHGV